MNCFGPTSSAAICALPGPIPFGGFLRGTATIQATASLLRQAHSALVCSAAISATHKVFVSAAAALVGTATIVARSNFVLYASTREWISGRSDQIPDQPFYGTLQPSIQFDRSIIDIDGFGKATIGWGEITLINTDGYYDEIVRTYTPGGRRVLLKVGAGDVFDDYFTVLDGIASRVDVEDALVRILVRDSTYKLEVPAQPRTYAGTGGLQGGSDLANKRRPKAWGYCKNVTPAFLDTGSYLFQVNDGPVQAITAVYSRGVPLTFHTDYPNSTALLAASIPSSYYATCLAEGLFRVEFVLEGEITADVQGDKTGGVFVYTAADIIRRVASGAGIADADVDAVSFATVNALQSAPIGYYLDTGSNAMVADVGADIAGSIGGWFGFRRDNRLELGIFRSPEGVVPTARYSQLDTANEDGVKREDLPSGIFPPPYRYRVAFDHNWTVQTSFADTLTFVDPDRIAFLSQADRLAEASDTTILQDFPQAQDPAPIKSYFRDEADALAEAQRRLDLFGGTCSLYRIILPGNFVHEIGDVIEITYPRWDLTEGQLLRLVEVSERTATRQVEVVGFRNG